MNYRYILIVVQLALLALSTSAKGGNEHEPVSARVLGQGRCSLLIPDCWAAINNVGALHSDTGIINAGIYTGSNWTNSFPGISALAISKQIKRGSIIGAGILRNGSLLYSETRIVAGFSRKINCVQIGLGGSYISNQTAGLNTTGAMIMEFGCVANIEKLTLGANLYNITNSYIGSEKNKAAIPQSFRGGAKYSIHSNVSLSAEYYYSQTLKSLFRVGTEFTIDSLVNIRGGYESGTKLMTFGVGLNLKHTNLDFVTIYQPILGPAIMFSANFKINFRKANKD